MWKVGFSMFPEENINEVLVLVCTEREFQKLIYNA